MRLLAFQKQTSKAQSWIKILPPANHQNKHPGRIQRKVLPYFKLYDLWIPLWKLSSRTCAAAYILGEGKTIYCKVRVVLLRTNNCQWSTSPLTESSWAVAEWVSCVFKYFHIFSHVAKSEYKILC